MGYRSPAKARWEHNQAIRTVNVPRATAVTVYLVSDLAAAGCFQMLKTLTPLVFFLCIAGCTAKKGKDLALLLEQQGTSKDFTKAVAFVNSMSSAEVQAVNIHRFSFSGSLAEYAIDHCSAPLFRATMSKGVRLNSTTETSTRNTISDIRKCPETAELMKVALASGLNPNQKDSHGLDSAAAFYHKEDSQTAFLLLDYGANANAVGRDGKTWLELAIYSRNFQLVERLWRAGATLKRLKDLPGSLWWLFLSVSNNEFSLKSLTEQIKAEALIDAVDKEGRNLFSSGVSFGSLELANAGLSLGSRLDIKATDGSLPAEKAYYKSLENSAWLPIFRRTAELCSFHLEAPMAEGGRTALIVAIENSIVKRNPAAELMVLTLLDLGADPTTPVGTFLTGTERHLAEFAASHDVIFSDARQARRLYLGERMSPAEQAHMSLESILKNAKLDDERAAIQASYERILSALRDRSARSRVERSRCK